MLASATSAASSALVRGRTNARRERSANRTQLAGQRELPCEFVFREPVGLELVRGGEDAERDGQIESAALLGELRRSEIDRDAPRWKVEARVYEGGAHPVAALLHFGVRQTDDGERGQAVRQMHLDGDCGRVQSRERTAVEHRERHRGLLVAQPRLEFGDARFQLGEFIARAREYLGLDLELCARCQV